MNADSELLREYAETRSAAAFADVVRRHVNLVYSVAYRKVGGDAHLAHDVAQEVFTALARKAGEVARRPSLAGWLYRSTHFAASDVVRAERRRREREKEANAMEQIFNESTSTADWDRVRPLLDDAIAELNDRDRDAVTLRFLASASFGEVGRRLGLTENAARMRVERALDKLHASLAKRGIRSTGAALGVALGHQAGIAAPAGLAAETAAAVAAITPAVGWGGASPVVVHAGAHLAVAAGIVLVGGGLLFFQTRTAGQLSEERDALRRELASLSRGTQSDAGVVAPPASAPPNPPPRTFRSANPEEVDPLRAAGMKPMSEWRNLGQDTPAAALETMMWASIHRDFDALAKTIAFSEESQRDLDAWFASLPPDVQRKHGTAHRAIAPAFAEQWPLLQRLALVRRHERHEIGYRVRGQRDQAGGRPTVLEILFTYLPDPDRPFRTGFVLRDGLWRTGPIGGDTIKMLTSRIDPRTGELRPDTASETSP